METVIKQAEESKRNSMDSARRLFEDYRPLKHDVDLMRTELLGLEKLPDLPNEDKEKMAAIGVMDKPKFGSAAGVWPQKQKFFDQVENKSFLVITFHKHFQRQTFN